MAGNNGINSGKSDPKDPQEKAIETVSGPVLIIAGPGTGKTHTLVQRAIRLIQNGVAPEEIMMATFTEKAAKELITRITIELSARNITANLDEMYIGTFHSICRRILEDNLELTRLTKNFRTLDTFHQKYLVNRHIDDFRKDDPDSFYRFVNFAKKNNDNEDDNADDGNGEAAEDKPKNYDKDAGWWWIAEKICDCADKLTEEMADTESMLYDEDPDVAAVGKIVSIYRKILNDENALDYSAIQWECYKLLSDHGDVLRNLQDKIQYFMIDEYQDTNYIQEQLVLMLGGKNNNICVVGDDDQGMYRFRGATIGNIFDFPNKPQFGGNCTQIKLEKNYRSGKGIVDFYQKWMNTPSGGGFKINWGGCRYEKTITAERGDVNTPSVISLSAPKSYNDKRWHEKIYEFINELKASGKITNYNQIAFLFRSVKQGPVRKLSDFLEEKGIPVYSPRSNMFFYREEIMRLTGCLMLMFPNYVRKLENGEYDDIFSENRYGKTEQTELCKYYIKCMEMAESLIDETEHADLKDFIERHSEKHANLNENTDYNYSGLIYRLFGFEPFKGILSVDINEGVFKTRPERNLANFTKYIAEYEDLQNIRFLSSKRSNGEKRYDADTERLFNTYLRLLFDEDIREYEDDSEYAPRDCVSFMTYHQAKGMEFPVVFACSLGGGVNVRSDDFLPEGVKKHLKKYGDPDFSDPERGLDDMIPYHDFWRSYYVAFSRAQDLLVLTFVNDDGKNNQHLGNNDCLSLICRDKTVKSTDDSDFDMTGYGEFNGVKPVRLKKSYSFTAHTSVYGTCPLRYRFYRELGFSQATDKTELIGTLVHETVEDINRSAIACEGGKDITEKNILEWFNENRCSLEKSENVRFEGSRVEDALNQVFGYVNGMEDSWDSVIGAEEDIKFVTAPETDSESDVGYIIEGKIDLIKKDSDGSVELVDFKTESKPDANPQTPEMMRKRNKMMHYKEQLELYSWLIGQQTGRKVSQMSLYYTAEKGNSPTVTFPYDEIEVNGVADRFKKTIRKIRNGEFDHGTDNRVTCRNCDFRFYCGKT